MEVAGGVGTGSVVGDVLSRAAVQAQIPKDQHLVGGEGQSHKAHLQAGGSGRSMASKAETQSSWGVRTR